MGKIGEARTSQICRSCLESSEKLYPLVGTVINVDVNIATMISYCISKELYLHENLPDSVCVPCFKIIRIAYNFLRQFKESEEKLLREQKCKQEPEHLNELVCDNTEGETELNEEEQNITEFVNKYDDNEIDLIKHDLETIHNYAERRDSRDIIDMHLEDVNQDSFNLQTVTQDLNESENEEYTSSLVEYVEDPDQLDDASEDTKVVANTSLMHLEDVKQDSFNLQTVVKDFKESETEEYSSSLIEYVEDPHEVDDASENAKVIANASLEVVEEYLIWDESVSESVSTKNKPLSKSQFIQKDDVRSLGGCEFTCPICNITFQRLQKFNDHVVSHDTDMIICNKCPMPVELNIFQYVQHYKELHRYQCRICNRSLTSSYGFRYHMKQHENVRKYVCPTKNCKKSFLLLHLLKKHMRTHSNIVKYVCNLCGSNFRTYDTYRYHQKTHDGKRNHLCTECGKAFFQAVHLRDHMFRHTGYKHFTCDICGNSFTTNSQLKKHLNYCRKFKEKYGFKSSVIH